MLRDRRGFSLVELLVATAILLTAAIGLIVALITAVGLTEDTRETALASEAARKKIEEMQETPFDTIFSTHVANPHFDVDGLIPRESDPDGHVGKILFPSVANAPPMLSEAVADTPLGMPRDLNGNGNATDMMTNGYLILPVRVKIDWEGRSGSRSFELLTSLSE